MKILAIDTSCDETSVAILENRRVLSNVVSSQTELHKKWGGVVPMIARRAHEENLPISVKEALKRAKLTVNELDIISATQGPGLAIDLEVGLKYAQQLAVDNQKPFIPVNHMEGHLLSSLILNSKGVGRLEEGKEEEIFPALGLLVSGKHTELIYVKGYGQYEKLGKTLDDAAGEAFDKFGRMMGFGYPGGPIVAQFAKKGIPGKFGLPIPMEKSPELNFSYSGLKTSALYKLNALREAGKKDKEFANDFCAEFEDVLVKSITIKLERALKKYPEVKHLLTGGGVFKNERLTRSVGVVARKHNVNYLLPEDKYRSDNAAMIGLVAYFNALRGEVLNSSVEILEIDRIPRLEL